MMTSGGTSSDAPRIAVDAILRSPKGLRAAASKRFLEDGRVFNSDGRQERYSCSGGAPVAKSGKESKAGGPSADPSFYAMCCKA